MAGDDSTAATRRGAHRDARQPAARRPRRSPPAVMAQDLRVGCRQRAVRRGAHRHARRRRPPAEGADVWAAEPGLAIVLDPDDASGAPRRTAGRSAPRGASRARAGRGRGPGIPPRCGGGPLGRAGPPDDRRRPAPARRSRVPPRDSTGVRRRRGISGSGTSSFAMPRTKRFRKRSRADLHRRFADWLEAKAGARSTEYEEILGHHLERAYRYLDELGPIGPVGAAAAARAADWLERAGRRAYDRRDSQAAVNLLSRSHVPHARGASFPARSPADRRRGAWLHDGPRGQCPRIPRGHRRRGGP